MSDEETTDEKTCERCGATMQPTGAKGHRMTVAEVLPTGTAPDLWTCSECGHLERVEP